MLSFAAECRFDIMQLYLTHNRARSLSWNRDMNPLFLVQLLRQRTHTGLFGPENKPNKPVRLLNQQSMGNPRPREVAITRQFWIAVVQLGKVYFLRMLRPRCL